MISQTGATIFATSSTEKMRVQASGNVSIGNTNDTFRLDVSGTLRATGAATFSSSVTAGGTLTTNLSNGTVIIRDNGTAQVEVNIRHTSTRNGVLSFTESGVADRWAIGTKPSDGTLYFGSGFDLSTTRFTLSSVGAATFTSSVKAKGLISYGASGGFTSGDNPFVNLANEGTADTFGSINHPFGDKMRFNAYHGFEWFTSNNGASATPVTKMILTSNGNVGIGTSNPFAVTNYTYLSLQGTTGSGLKFYNGSTAVAEIGADAGSLAFQAQASNPILFLAGGNERMRITSGGYLKASNNGQYQNTGDYHEIRNNAADWIALVDNRSSISPFGLLMRYTAASPNGTGNRFIVCADSTADRFEVRSNGGIGNYQANNVNLSDVRTKKDITPLGSYWDKFKAIEMVKFKYKDQTHDDFNIGVIAQQVEKVAPEFVDVDGWGDTPKDGVPLKSIYTADLHHATIKVLQEAMAKIEDLQNQLDTLKNK